MGVFRVFLVLGLLTAVCLWAFWGVFFPIPDPPEIKDNWWGEGPPGSVSTKIRQFKISFKDSEISDLKSRLSSPRLKSPLEGSNFEYGFNTDFLEKVLDYWRTQYDFSSRERYLNTYPHYVTNVDGIDLHYVHVRPSTSRRTVPLLLLHGWPGSFVEFLRIAPLLTADRAGEDFVFELIIPSLPGYGYSEEAHKPGCGGFQMTQMMLKLMKRLGHDTFYVQGGDWGSYIAIAMATVFPQHVRGMHINMVVVDTNWNSFKWLFGGLTCHHFVTTDADYSKLYPLKDKLPFLLQETGYMHLQGTKPDTVGVSLSDSPAGLAAYILEKFSTWTNKAGISAPDGHLLEKFTLDELLDNVMVYWHSNSITSSMRLYAETFSKKGYEDLMKIINIPTSVPAGLAAFPSEIMSHPLSFVTGKFTNIIDYTDMPTGGHFAAFEEPQLLADHIWGFISKVEALNDSQ